MEGERTSGPSHVEDGGGDALQRKSQDMHRSRANTDGSGSPTSSMVPTQPPDQGQRIRVLQVAALPKPGS
jgi:hypothetical protein